LVGVGLGVAGWPADRGCRGMGRAFLCLRRDMGASGIGGAWDGQKGGRRRRIVGKEGQTSERGPRGDRHYRGREAPRLRLSKRGDRQDPATKCEARTATDHPQTM
jgi:hypothetical protein